MTWCKVIVPLFLLLVVGFDAVNSSDLFKSPIKIHCVKDVSDEDWTTFEIKYEDTMASTKDHKFDQLTNDNITLALGNPETVTVFFTEYDDVAQPEDLESARENLRSRLNKAAFCMVENRYLGEVSNYDRGYKRTVRGRLPFLVQMMAAFIQHIKISYNIKMEWIQLGGYGLGGHIAGNVGHRMRDIFPNELFGAIFAFDPPLRGFTTREYYEDARHVQKGDAKRVIIFHVSRFCDEDPHGDIDVYVNGNVQPGCESDIDEDACSHRFICILHYLIANSNWNRIENNGYSSGVFRKDGGLVVFKGNDCTDKSKHSDIKTAPVGSWLYMSFLVQPALSGIYHMHSDNVVTLEKSVHQKMSAAKNSSPAQKKSTAPVAHQPRMQTAVREYQTPTLNHNGPKDKVLVA